MDAFITENGLMTKKTVVECKYGQMEVDMRDSGNKTKLTDMAEWFMLKVIFSRETGVMTKPTDRASTRR